MDLQDFSLEVGVRKRLEKVLCSHLKCLNSPPTRPEEDLLFLAVSLEQDKEIEATITHKPFLNVILYYLV